MEKAYTTFIIGATVILLLLFIGLIISIMGIWGVFQAEVPNPISGEYQIYQPFKYCQRFPLDNGVTVTKMEIRYPKTIVWVEAPMTIIDGHMQITVHGTPENVGREYTLRMFYKDE